MIMICSKKKEIIGKSLLLFLLFSVIYIPIVKADSGLDYNYNSSNSGVESVLGFGSSFLSPIAELIKIKPGDTDYQECQIAVGIVFAIILYIITTVYIFRLKNDIPKSKKKNLIILGVSLIPVLIFLLFCLLTKLLLGIYILIVSIFVIIFVIIIKNMIKKNLQRKIKSVKEIDKNFDEEIFKEKAFNIYKRIQLAWSDFKLYKIKNIISDEMYNKYEEQLDKLKKDNQKNIMDKIELKSNKIVDIKIENNIEIIECKMNITCYDYIINDKEKVIKGRKNRQNNLSYKLVFNKNLDSNKYILVEKKVIYIVN